VSAIVIDVGARLVRLDGRDIPLAAKAFDLLLLLARSRPNVISHAQLHAALWPRTHVSETSLAALVAQVRKMLGDSPGESEVIRTRHRVGYALVADVVIAGAGSDGVTPVGRVIWHGQTIELPPGASVIGRDRECGARVDADSISRRHARVSVNGIDATIEDLDSKNGTWIAGERISGVVPLRDGTTFRLGSESFRFEMLSDRSTVTGLRTTD
jgi:DNA-binding winged helix-turn-helix (wHTH) protein